MTIFAFEMVLSQRKLQYQLADSKADIHGPHGINPADFGDQIKTFIILFDQKHAKLITNPSDSAALCVLY